MGKYRVVTVTNDLENNPEYAEDTIAYPDLIKYVEGDLAIFVIDLTNDKIYSHDEFFIVVGIKEFMEI